MDPTTHSMIQQATEAMLDCDVALSYSQRHGIRSIPALTIKEDEHAWDMACHLQQRIQGKVVVEIGGGLGLLALHMGQFAKQVFCIEANPLWATSFLSVLFEHKPKNVSYLFGAADEFAGALKADIAIVCSHSGVKAMVAAGRLFAPVVVDVYGEMIEQNPGAFDATAIALRSYA